MTDLLPDLAPAPVSPSALPSPAPDNPAEALSWLGETVEEVAEGLRARGIKGKIAKAGSCPLANYLAVWWGETHVWRSYAVRDTTTGLWGPAVACPDNVFEFAVKFDSGAFPDLIAD